MVFNLTGSNIDLYFTVNTAINAGITCLMILPAVVLSLLSIVALLFAKEINWPIRVLIINILAAEIVFWVGYAFLIIGFIPRLHIAGEGNVSCRVALSLVVVSSPFKLSAIALYAINVYIFIRYGLKKVKWSFIVLYLVISWVASIAIGLLPVFSLFEISVNNGFCDNDPTSPLYRALLGVSLPTIITLLSITIVFSLLTYCYAKKNVLDDNVEIKKAVAKNLYYLAIASIFTFFYSVAPSASALIKAALKDQDIVGIVATNYSFQVFFILPSVASSIAAIIILKPLRLAMKQGFSKCFACICCRAQAEVPS